MFLDNFLKVGDQPRSGCLGLGSLENKLMIPHLEDLTMESLASFFDDSHNCTSKPLS